MKTIYLVHATTADGSERILGRCFTLRDGLERISNLPAMNDNVGSCWIGEYRGGELVTRHEGSAN